MYNFKLLLLILLYSFYRNTSQINIVLVLHYIYMKAVDNVCFSNMTVRHYILHIIGSVFNIKRIIM